MQILLLQLYKVTIGIPELIPKRVVHAIPMYSDMICRHKHKVTNSTFSDVIMNHYAFQTYTFSGIDTDI